MLENFFDNDLIWVTAISGKYHKLKTFDGYDTEDTNKLICYALHRKSFLALKQCLIQPVLEWLKTFLTMISL